MGPPSRGPIDIGGFGSHVKYQGQCEELTMARNPAPDESGAERAVRLREQIKRLKEGAPDAPSSKPTPAANEKLSPRDFIHKRMRELDQKK